MPTADDHDLEGPSSPPRAASDERSVLENNALLLLRLKRSVIDKHMRSALFTMVFNQLLEFRGRLFGHTRCDPDLPVWMRIRAAHCLTFILEDLHEAILGVWAGEMLVLMVRWWQGGRS